MAYFRHTKSVGVGFIKSDGESYVLRYFMATRQYHAIVNRVQKGE